MPERVHQHFDGSKPTSIAEVNNKKRKRGQSREVTLNHTKSNDQPTNQIQVNGAQPNNKVKNKSPLATVNGVNGTSGQKGPRLRLHEHAESLEPLRKRLPIYWHQDDIRGNLQHKDVMLLVGETGSGKSTQVPQILMGEHWCNSQTIKVPVPGSRSSEDTKIGGCIAITEPRRVAAITLARRVAEETGSPLGRSSPKSKVGYSVRFDNNISPKTKIKFLTEGTLLQEMLRDPWLKAYSAVIIDEVHERGVNVDLIMGFMRQMLVSNHEGRGGIPLKVVVMSATAELQKLKSFFEDGYTRSDKLSYGNFTESDPDKAMENGDVEESEWAGIPSSGDQHGPTANDTGASETTAPLDKTTHSTGLVNGHRDVDTAEGETKHVATCYIKGRQYPVDIKYTPEPVDDIVEASLRTIFQIHRKEAMPGDVLVFLTGQEAVESLESLVKDFARGLTSDLPKMLVLPLFAALPQTAQQRVFEPAPPKTRKIIIATNIAETSVTVSGVRFVVDCGKAKVKHFRSNIGLDSLLVKPISKSAAIQRKGRAGREASGQCYRLYTESDYLKLQKSATPEILRCDLSLMILTVKARGVTDPTNFPFLDPPPREALGKAFLQLHQLGALDDAGDLSPIGQKMARLPLTAALGRVLIEATLPTMACVSEVIDVISCLSVENVFLNMTSDEGKEQAEAARRDLYHRTGDHLTLLNTVQAYAAEKSDRKAWAERHFVSHRAMQSVMNVRKQLRKKYEDSLNIERAPDSDLITAILKCFLKGFATHTARLVRDGSYKTLFGNQPVAVHPSSWLNGKKSEAIMYNQFVYTTKAYAREVSLVQMDWIFEALPVTDDRNKSKNKE